MIELRNNGLVFAFPEVHPEARMTVHFQRTLRIPDDGASYPLPPGLGSFPLRHVDDFAPRIPPAWLEQGGVMLPMYQAEAMWLHFDDDHIDSRGTGYPFAIKVATGKLNAVTGSEWRPRLHRPQDYLVAPEQPWLDGYCVEQGLVRQFVAMPLGAGYTAEEQLTGKAEHGGLQIMVYPMKREAFERRFPSRAIPTMAREADGHFVLFAAPAMGLAPGGLMRQEIYADPFDINDWDTDHSSRCFVHIANSMVWRAITGGAPPTTPPTSEEYTRAGLPWFDYLDENANALRGSKILAGLKSVFTMGKEKGDVPLPENQTVEPAHIRHLRKGLKEAQVREGVF